MSAGGGAASIFGSLYPLTSNRREASRSIAEPDGKPRFRARTGKRAEDRSAPPFGSARGFRFFQSTPPSPRDRRRRRARSCTVTMSPARNGRRVAIWTAPSICGASPLVRPLAPCAPPSSTMTASRLPTFAASFFALIACCAQHEALVARGLDLGGHLLEAEIVRLRARDRLVLEGADAVELGFVQPVEQHAENPPPSRRESRR